MTILISYKQQEKCVFVSDFRVSFNTANQVDAMSKFLAFDNRLAFFTAGSVVMWSMVVPVIRQVIDQVNLLNVCDEDGPLISSLRNMTEQTPYSAAGLFGGFGIYVDTATNQNIVFQIRGLAGRGLQISHVSDGVTVIGSGANIPNIEGLLRVNLDDYVEVNEFILKPTAEKLRNEIKEILVKCGSSSFEKLGISPIFNISGLIGSAFQMFGEEIEGGRFVSGGMSREYHFSFERVNGALVLRDLLSNTEHCVHDITTFQHNGSVGIEFDPEGLTEGFDPSSCVSGHNIYFISQWVEDSFLERTIFKTTPFGNSPKLLANPNYIQLASAVCQARTSGKNIHLNVYRHGLIINPVNQNTFEEVIQQSIFDDDLLTNYIENINDLFIP